MKTLVSTALKFQLTIPEVVEMLKAEGHSVNPDYRTKLTKQQYAIVAASQGITERESEKPKQKTKQRFGSVKFYASDKAFGFITDAETSEDHYFRESHLNTEAVADGNLVVFTSVPSKYKPGTKEARAVIHFAECKNMELLCAVYLKSDNTFIRQTVLQNIQPGDVRYLVTQELDQFPTVDNDTAYKALASRIDGYQAWLPDPTDKQSLNDIAYANLRKGPAVVYPVRWWLEGRTDQKPDEAAMTEAYPSLAQVQRFTILATLPELTRYELLTRQGKQESYLVLLRFMETYVRQRNDVPANDDKTIADYQNQQLTDYPLYEWTAQFVRPHLTQKQEAEGFFAGQLFRVSLDYLINNPEQLTINNLERLAVMSLTDEQQRLDFARKVFQHDLPRLPAEKSAVFSRTENLLNFLKTEPSRQAFKTEITDALSLDYRVLWWENGLLKAPIIGDLLSFLRRNDLPLKRLARWRSTNRCSTEQIATLLADISGNFPDCKTSADLYRFYEQLALLPDLFPEVEVNTLISPHNANLLYVLRWARGEDIAFSFDEFKNTLVYLRPEDQLTFLRRMFGGVARKEIILAPSQLREVTAIDLDVYHLAAKHHPDDHLDISLHVVIAALNAYAEHGRFLLEGELLKVVLQNLWFAGDQRRFTIDHLFEHCAGRMVLENNLSGNRRIQKEVNGDNKPVLIFHFPYDADLVLAVKKLPGARYLADRKVWQLPYSQVAAATKFAHEHGFRLETDGDRYVNNAHLATFKREKIPPPGIRYCEGRQSNKPGNISGKTFWWCHNKPCHQNCQTVHDAANWEKYTLLDFCLLLGFNLDSTSKYSNESIPYGKYHQFVSVINRFRILLDHLYCRSCEHVLQPVEDSHYAFYRVVRFRCRNTACTENHEVYLHHCFNKKCSSIIDSRDTNKCSNGWHICTSDKCGCCCSHGKNVERKQNLERNNQHPGSKLLADIANKVGHLERGTHFCYGCGNKMNKLANEIYNCSDCLITYETIGNRFDRSNME